MSTLMVIFWLVISSCGIDSLETSNQGCQMAKLDLVIIVDSSASVGSVNFKEIVKFILDLVKPLPVHSDGIRVALVRYSSDASVISYLGDDMTKIEKAAALGKMKYKPGSTRTDLAIALTRDQVLIPERGDRPEVPDQVILLTDGTSTNKQGTRDEIRWLKTRTALKIIVLGIGNQLDDAELLEIATSPELKHVVTNFSHLSGLLKDLESATCEDRSKIVTQSPVIEVLTTPEEVLVVQLNNSSSEPSFEDNFSLYPPSCVNESVYPSEVLLIQQFDTTISNVQQFDTQNSNIEAYSILISEKYKSSSDDLIFPSSSLPYTSSLLSVTPSFYVYSSESSVSKRINDSSHSSESIRESLLVIETSTPTDVQRHVTTTVLDDDLISTAVPIDVLSSTQLPTVTSIKDYDVTISSFSLTLGSDSVHFAENMTPSTQLSTVASVKDPYYDYDVPISSVREYGILSAHSTLGYDSVHFVETMTSSIPTPPLTPPMLLSILIPSSDLFLESVTSSSSIVTSVMNSSPSESIMPTSTTLYSLDYSMTDLSTVPISRSENDSFSSVSSVSISPTFTLEYTQSQSHISNTGSSKTVLFTEHNVFVNVSINSSSVETQNSKTGGDISPDFVYIFIGGGIVGLVALLATSIILARIFRRRKEEEVPT